MVLTDPAGRLSLPQAKDYINSIRESISMNGAIKLMEEEESQLPKLSYKSTREEYNSILQSITNQNGGESRLNIVPLRPISKEKSLASHTTTNCKSLAASQLALSVAHRKENRLNLSNLTSLQSGSRRKERTSRGIEEKLVGQLSSFR